MSTNTFDRRLAITTVEDTRKMKCFMESNEPARILSKPSFSPAERKQVEKLLKEHLSRNDE